MKKIFTLTCAASAVKFVVAAIVLVKIADIGLDKLADKQIKRNS